MATSQIGRRLAKAEAKMGGGDKLWVVSGYSEADFNAAITKLKSERGAHDRDLFVCVRRFTEGGAALGEAVEQPISKGML